MLLGPRQQPDAAAAMADGRWEMAADGSTCIMKLERCSGGRLGAAAAVIAASCAAAPERTPTGRRARGCGRPRYEDHGRLRCRSFID